MRTNKIKVLHAPSAVGGNIQNLSFSLRQLGIESKSLALLQNKYLYPSDIIVWSSNDGLIMREIKRIKAIFYEIMNFDLIHFNFGTTIASPNCYPSHKDISRGIKLFMAKMLGAFYTNILQIAELNLLKLMNKPIFVTYQGDDARQGDYCLANFEICIASQVDESYYNKRSDNFKRRQIKRIAKFAKKIYAVNPDLLHVLPHSARFIPYSNISLNEWIPSYKISNNNPLRILHAPTHRKAKGTDLLLHALDSLKIEGYKFDLILVEGVSNAVAKKMYESSDILVDQLFAGWYGGLAVELMALGKPVVVYIRKEDLKFIPAEMAGELPFIFANPSNIKNVIKTIINMPRHELISKGRKSRAFVEKWHDPMKIALEMKKDYVLALDGSK